MPDSPDNIMLAEIPDGAAALEATLEWIGGNSWPPSASPGEQATGGFGDIARRLSEALASAELEAWAARLAAFAGVASDGGLREAAAVTTLLDEAGLRVAERADHPQLFALVDDLWEMSMSATSDPTITLVERLAGSPEDHPLASRLAERIAEISAFFAGKSRFPRGRPAGSTRTRDLWPGPDEIPIDRRWVFKVAARVWPRRFMGMLDEVPPAVAHSAIVNAGPFDLNSLLPLLEGGQPKRDDAGIAWAPPAAYALLAEIVEALAKFIGDHGVGAAKAAADPLLDRLGQRADWPWLGRAWLQQLIWHGAARRARSRSADADHWSDARDVLLSEIAARAAPMPTAAQDWIMGEEELWRVYRVLAEAAILLTQGTPEAAGELLAKAIVEGQVTSTARDEAFRTGSPEGKIVGAIVRALADPADWFSKLWCDTFEARERAACRVLESYLNPADPALVWGVTGLNSMSDPERIARLWRPLADATVERILTDPQPDVPGEPRDTIIRAMVLLGTHFQLKGVIGQNDSLRVLIPLVEPSERFVALAEAVLAADGAELLSALGDRIGREALAATFAAALAGGTTPTAALLAFLGALQAPPQ